MSAVEDVFGIGCNLIKVADSFFEGVETYEVNGETGESEESIWDWISQKNDTITFDTEMMK